MPESVSRRTADLINEIEHTSGQLEDFVQLHTEIVAAQRAHLYDLCLETVKAVTTLVEGVIAR
jgi:hypothetical protein